MRAFRRGSWPALALRGQACLALTFVRSRLGLLSRRAVEVCAQSSAVAHIDSRLESSDRSSALEG